jgi:hypothetical protein
MALTSSQIENIAADAVNLCDALERHGVGSPRASEWVAGAMMAIVIAETEIPVREPDPLDIRNPLEPQ